MSTKSTFGDKLAYWALLVFEKPFGLMPTSLMWRIGAGIGGIAHRFAKKRKAIVQANLRIVKPHFSDSQINDLTKEVFRNSFGNLASSINTSFASRKRLEKTITLSGAEQISKLAPDRGCIMLVFHMGNWEVLSRIAPLFNTDKPSAAMFRPLNNALINEHITRGRERDGTLLFGRKRGLIKAHKFLKNEHGLLGILSDQYSGAAGIKLPLFGKETSITPLPVMLAQKYDCPIMPVIVTTVSPGKWQVEFQDHFKIPRELDKSAATRMLVPIFEKIMSEHCSDIFWLHDRWKLKHTLNTTSKT